MPTHEIAVRVAAVRTTIVLITRPVELILASTGYVLPLVTPSAQQPAAEGQLTATNPAVDWSTVTCACFGAGHGRRQG